MQSSDGAYTHWPISNHDQTRGTLLCFIVGVMLHFLTFSPFIAFYNDLSPYFIKIWKLSLVEDFWMSFSSHYSWVNSSSSTSQPLSGGTLSTIPSNFHLTPPGGIVNSSTFFRVVAYFPVGHFITSPPLHDNLEKYPSPLLIPPPAMKHKRE